MPGPTVVATRPALLILAHAFPPDPLSGAARPGRFVKYLPQFGYEPIVICGGEAEAANPKAVHRVPTSAPSNRAALLAKLAALGQRYMLPYDDQLPWAVHAVAAAETVIAERSVAAVLSTSPPLGTHLAALWLKRRHGVPWVADFRDPLHGNPFRSRRWVFPYDAMMERLLVRQADALVANTDALADLWRRRHSREADKVSVIWNGFDPEDRIDPLPTPTRDRRVLAHVGSLYGGRHPGAVFASLVRLIQRGDLSPDRVLAQLVGYVEAHCIQANLDAIEALRGWGCLHYDGRVVSTAEARCAAAQADYLLLLDLNPHGAALQVPGKLFEYLQIGRPILAFTHRDSPTDRILRGSGVPCRLVYEGADDAEIDRQVLGVFDLPPKPVRASPWFEEQFDGRNQTRTLASLIGSLREGRRDAVVSSSEPMGESP